MQIYTKSQAKEEIKKLINKYENLSKLVIRKYNEANTRKDFILPLFKVLGWDVYNDSSDNEVVEEETTISGRIDYSFRINNITQFLLEAKALPEDLNKEKWAHQAIEYGWNKGITWVVLTDFDGLKVFNSEWKLDQPHSNIDLSHKDYLTKFDKLWLLSRESIGKGELDKQAKEWGIIAKRVNVNEKLAKDLIGWRDILTTNFEQWNKGVNRSNIAEAVQRILDRLIFIRVVEDRGIEEKILWQTYQRWKTSDNFITHITPLFREFDKKYNSNLFQKHLCESLETEGVPFQKIIPDLYADKEGGVKYRFDAINADVLGNVYEQYLGHVQKREGETSKRKKQGIYYTPGYIVDYIIRNTLGKLLEETSSLQDKENIKILDPACGSGSFLIKAFEIMDEHLRKIRNQKVNGQFQGAIRKYGILTQNIYGVDLDEQAIEIARLNLLLKALVPGYKLPLLTNHMKVGNSLISDKKITNKAFNWQNEFPEVFKGKNPGFDVIIGNPPYIDSETMTKTQLEFRKYCTEKYSGAKGNWDLFCIFIEKGLNLLKDGGYFGMIVPNKLLSTDYAEQIREILKRYKIICIKDYSSIPVFKASVYPIVIIVKKESSKKKHKIIIESFSEIGLTFSGEIFQEELKSHGKGWQLSFKKGIDFNFLNRSKTKIKLLKEICNIHGAATVSEAYEIKKILKEKDNQKDFFKFINTGTIDKYFSFWDKQPTRYLGDSYNKPIVLKKDLKKLLPKRYKDALNEKIIVAGLTKGLQCILDKGKYLAGKSTTIIIPKTLDSKIILVILNSKLMTVIYKKIFKSLALGGGYLNVGPRQLASLPIIVPIGETKHNLIKSAVEMLNLNKDLQKCVKDSDKCRLIQVDIEKVNKEIDQLVYKLYGLTQEEIKIVETGNE